MSVQNNRKPDFSIHDQFINRWSPRAFLDKEISEELLYSTLEAARWAPSSMNSQPWRFIIARTKEDRERFHSFILDGNRTWCEQAPVLILLISEKAAGAHTFDTGTAFGFLTLQALENGLATHPMGGFDKEKAREVLGIPNEYELHAVVALGYQGDKTTLTPTLQDREAPSPRRPLKESIFEGTFSIE
ncbi:malonic semialdehyde reductase RutE [Paraliobacillus ryukyuensis]|uniref:Nitroreductase n=1 Tax=Paraliobacillus ryukyuensis TaxID=200904 RepID=A0A366EE57_9BACI|nr:nitroreductase family protein [Paraliobacillus ryukyuensis]RBP00603.1 nitroreductase [Paraliobacillus ryukyuensis]